MTKKIRPAKETDVTAYLRRLFLKTEKELIREIMRKRSAGYVDYAEVAALERVQKILQDMVDESWEYIPEMIETIFYHSDKDAAGYANARTLTAAQTDVVQQLSNNLLGEVMEMAGTARKSVEAVFTIARLENDPFRRLTLEQVLRQEAAGSPWIRSSRDLVKKMERDGITAFVDKSGRRWSLRAYGNMAVRTTARQAEVAALLTADDHDLWQIIKIGSTCPVCAPLEGRVYSKSGTNPDYPPLSMAFGKVDPAGGDNLANTWLNIHPSCLHMLTKYTTVGKTEKQIRRDRDFSDPEKNPVTKDPRSKKQIAAYREKERNRRKLLADMKQHKEYRAALGREVPKDFAKFREMKYNGSEKWEYFKLDYQRRNKLMMHPELKLPNAENARAASNKFTRYLFGGTHPEGLAKGAAFSSRLGYTEENWEELRREILKRAPFYPVVNKGSSGHGNNYEQQMILYGKKGKPANVLVAWSDDTEPDGIKMVSAYITEVKRC